SADNHHTGRQQEGPTKSIGKSWRNRGKDFGGRSTPRAVPPNESLPFLWGFFWSAASIAALDVLMFLFFGVRRASPLWMFWLVLGCGERRGFVFFGCFWSAASIAFLDVWDFFESKKHKKKIKGGDARRTPKRAPTGARAAGTWTWTWKRPQRKVK